LRASTLSQSATEAQGTPTEINGAHSMLHRGKKIN